MNRRSFLKSILAAGVAPAFVGSSILMPVKSLVIPGREALYWLEGNPTGESWFHTAYDHASPNGDSAAWVKFEYVDTPDPQLYGRTWRTLNIVDWYPK